MTQKEKVVPCPNCGAMVSTETDFSIWVRHADQLESNRYRISIHDRDWVIERGLNPAFGQALTMLVEEKTHLKEVPLQQLAMLRKFHEMCRADKRWMGSHVLQFENTSPLNGRIFLDGIEISIEQLIQFIRFEQPKSWYNCFAEQVDLAQVLNGESF